MVLEVLAGDVTSDGPTEGPRSGRYVHFDFTEISKSFLGEARETFRR